MDEVDFNISQKVKDFLTRKLNESMSKIKNSKQRRKINKSFYYAIISLSTIISTVLASISSLEISPIVTSILNMTSAVLTAFSIRFNFENRNLILNKEIEKLETIKNKLDYVISCNGNLTDDEFKKIISDFN